MRRSLPRVLGDGHLTLRLRRAAWQAATTHPGPPPIVETVTGGIVGVMASRKRIYDAEFRQGAVWNRGGDR